LRQELIFRAPRHLCRLVDAVQVDLKVSLRLEKGYR